MAAPLGFRPAAARELPEGAPARDRGPMAVVRIGGGQSNPTYRLRFASGDVVLRKQPSGELLPSAHAVDREFRVQSALAATAVPVPRMLHLCEDRASSARCSTSWRPSTGGWSRIRAFPGAPAERAAMYDAMNDVLARLHQVDWRAVGLEGFGKPGNYFARQIARWTRPGTHPGPARSRSWTSWPSGCRRTSAERRRDHHRSRRLPARQSDVSPPRAEGDRAARLGTLDARPSARRSRLQLPALAFDAGDVPRHRRARSRRARDPLTGRLCRPVLRANRPGRGITPFHLAFACSASR